MSLNQSKLNPNDHHDGFDLHTCIAFRPYTKELC